MQSNGPAKDIGTSRSLSILEASSQHAFSKPTKRIHKGHDVPSFLTSQAYRDIGIFVMQLNIAMCPRKSLTSGQTQSWRLGLDYTLYEPVRKLQELLKSIDAIIEEAPPDTGPRRFGNVSFRKWYEILESRISNLLQKHLPTTIFHPETQPENGVSVLDELTPYIMGGFGSSQRLDYGTGHELSFLAFLGCIWKLGGFTTAPTQDRELERSIVLGIIEPYLRVVRRLILTYTLEPAGSHGVWGLDDHSFLPYIFGSSQYCPPIADGDPMPIEGALAEAPNPGDVAKKNVVNRERKHNMYFSAVGFINDVKTGPFWEHSPILFDISGVKTGWGKINKGMIKMYNAEVLSKFPVIQHFPFGSLFSWEQDPNAQQVAASVHTANQPYGSSSSSSGPATARQPQESTRAPWVNPPGGPIPTTAAPWAGIQSQGVSSGAPLTRAPWAQGPSGNLPERTKPDGPTRAPWADLRGQGGR
ncbi:related to phosphotyrosyl phosphatase activator PTPA [Rhynchosporium secalis]|uniref:Serine/threonine-protein phosphatase 2A activator n=1 Tax=Rhynchosporium secalis TaxID=38038 RepID=A0A1E1MAG2_RHYSE|nr:related to phosphotyrosyl phosphatase activator PTPA [Rhynchosporium secalis]